MSDEVINTSDIWNYDNIVRLRDNGNRATIIGVLRYRMTYQGGATTMSNMKVESSGEQWDLARLVFEKAGLTSSEKDEKLALTRALRKEWMDGCSRRYLNESWLSKHRQGLSERHIKILERYTSSKSGGEAQIASLGKKFGYTFLVIEGKPYSYRKSYTRVLRGGAPQ